MSALLNNMFGDQTRQTKIYYRIVYFLLFQMLSISIEKQRKREPFFNFCYFVGGTRLSRRKYIIGLFIFTIWNAFNYHWKEKETPAFFQILLGWLCHNPGGEPAGGRGRLSFLPGRGQRRNLDFRMRLQLLIQFMFFIVVNETSILSAHNLHFDSVRHGAARGSMKKHW